MNWRVGRKKEEKKTRKKMVVLSKRTWSKLPRACAAFRDSITESFRYRVLPSIFRVESKRTEPNRDGGSAVGRKKKMN